MLERSTLLQSAPGCGLFTQDIKKPKTQQQKKPHTTHHKTLTAEAVSSGFA